MKYIDKNLTAKILNILINRDLNIKMDVNIFLINTIYLSLSIIQLKLCATRKRAINSY